MYKTEGRLPGLNFRLFRKILNKNQLEMADSLATSKSTISRIEQGKTAIKLEYLHALYAQFGLNINWLLTGRGSIFIPGMASESKAASINEKYFELFELMQIPGIETEIFHTLHEARSRLGQQKHKS